MENTGHFFNSISPDFHGLTESVGRSESTIFKRDEVPYENTRVVIDEAVSHAISTPKCIASRCRAKSHPLLTQYSDDYRWEIGIDEAGRGPMFGRLYVAGVVLPKGDLFRHGDMKDSKKFHSPKKIREVSDYIKQHAVAWYIHSITEQTIDQINIRQSVLRGMLECAKQCIGKLPSTTPETDVCLLIDGNDFQGCSMFDETRQTLIQIPHHTFEGGDNTYTAIAAASILAKVARDEYIDALCVEYPELDRRYGISQNKGYGTKRHLDGIKEHGICEFHRRSFGLCKTAKNAPLEN